jgi:hypothetical protein
MAQHYRKLRDGSFSTLQDGFQIPCTCRNCSVVRSYAVSREIERMYDSTSHALADAAATAASFRRSR